MDTSKLRVLLGSGGFRTPDRVANLQREMRSHFGNIQKILFVPYAVADHDQYVEIMQERGFSAGYILDGIHRHEDPVSAVQRAEGIYVGGGNTFRLLSDMYRHDIMDAIRQRVLGGMPYLGVSAGTNVACPTIQTTNDMPITIPPSFDGLGFVPFQINPHYLFGSTFVKSGSEFVEHFGETRDDRLREFHEMNDRPVLGLWEGGMLKVRDRTVDLIATNVRIFEKGKPTRDLQAGAKFDARTLELLS